MKNKKFFRVVALMMMSTLLLGGCSAKEKVESSTGEKTEIKTQTSEEQVNSSDESLPSWKRNTDPVELEWFFGYDWAAYNFDPVNNLSDKYIQEETGVTIKYSSGNLEKLNVLIATDKLPDIVTYDIISSERLMMEDSGLVLPLDELSEKYAPDLEVVDSMVDWYRNENTGKWYSYASFYYDIEDTEARGGELVSHNMNYARRDIMEQLGIKVEDLQTKKGFIDSLKKVQEGNVQYNGRSVEPYIQASAAALSEQFGLDREDSEGNLLNDLRQPEYLEALLFLNEIYREGLMSDEVFTMDLQLKKQKITSGEIFSGTGSVYMEGCQELYFADENAIFDPVGFIKGDANKEPIITPSATGGWTSTMISKNCKNPDRAIQLFAFLSQDEMELTNYNGGIDGYEIIDGKAVIKPEREAERAKDVAAYNAKYVSPVVGYIFDFVTYQQYLDKTVFDEFEMLSIKLAEYQKGRFYDDKIFTNVMPKGGSELAALQAQITEYWKAQEPQIIMAQSAEQCRQLYEEAIQQMDKMGMKELDEYKNECFQKNKEKMGEDLAWPRNK